MSLFNELMNFASAGMQSLPFMALAVLGYLGARNSSLKPLAIAWLAILLMGFALFAFSLSLLGAVDLNAFRTGTGAGAPTLLPAAQRIVIFCLVGITIGLLVGVLGFVPAIRRAFARVAPFDSNSFVQMLALISVVALAILCVTPLIAVGEPPLLKLLAQMSGAEAAVLGQSGDSMTRTVVYTLVWQVPCAILAVGLGLKRNLRQSLQRIGLVRPTLRNVVLGVATAIALVAAVTLLSQAINFVWGRMSWPTTDETQVRKLLAFALNPISALIVAVVAGLGEELTVRGVLQPRLGIMLPNIFFASLHAFQYNFDALVIVFVVGLSLGVLRARTNTTTSAIAHGSYDFILLMLATLQVPGFK